MIVKTFDQGWGNEWPAKQFEKKILDQYLAKVYHDDVATVIINSTWYSQDYHQQVMTQLKAINPGRIILVAMLDAAIPQLDWYSSFNCEIRGLGYYRGPDEIDYWALICDENMVVPDFNTEIDTAYMCLNRKPHWHRMRLYRELERRQLLDQGIVSMGGEDGQHLRLLPEDQGMSTMAPNAGTEQYGIANDIMSLGHQANWCRHFLNIVTETVYDIDQQWFVTEKIYKPILGSRPFLVYGQGATAWLDAHGFLNYNLDFADICDLDLSNPNNLPDFLETLVAQDKNYLKTKYLALSDKMHYNKTRFRNYAEEIRKRIQQGIPCQT
jgi:hypothetical protein